MAADVAYWEFILINIVKFAVQDTGDIHSDLLGNMFTVHQMTKTY